MNIYISMELNKRRYLTHTDRFLRAVVVLAIVVVMLITVIGIIFFLA